jgi:hypothetical protein
MCCHKRSGHGEAMVKIGLKEEVGASYGFCFLFLEE